MTYNGRCLRRSLSLCGSADALCIVGCAAGVGARAAGVRASGFQRRVERPSITRTQSSAAPVPEMGDYTELPINDAARLRADSFDPDRISVEQEYQCRPHSPDLRLAQPGSDAHLERYRSRHAARGLLHTHMLAWDAERTVYMDDRPHPPDWAPHTLAGILDREMVWQHGNHHHDAPEGELPPAATTCRCSEAEAVVTEHWIRHGDLLTIIMITEDPVFLTEPLVRSTN